MLSLMISTSVLANDKNCWNQWLDGEYVLVCNEKGRNAIDLELIKGDEAMDALVSEVNKRPAIRLFWGITGFLGGYLASKAIN